MSELEDFVPCPVCRFQIVADWVELRCSDECRGLFQTCEDCGTDIELLSHSTECPEPARLRRDEGPAYVVPPADPLLANPIEKKRPARPQER